MTHLPTILLGLGLASCAAPAARTSELHGPSRPVVRRQAPATDRVGPRGARSAGLEWNPQVALMQGFIGVSQFRNVSVEGDGSSSVDGDGGDIDQLLLIGGGGQWKLGGERIDLGLEGLLCLSGRVDATAFVVGGSGAAIAVDVDLLLFELYGGPFASVFLGDKLRLYGAAGPLLQWADYDQSGSGLADSGSGFGSGLYARAGIELVLPSRTLIGIGARWSDTTVDLGSRLGDLDIDGLQALITVSRGL